MDLESSETLRAVKNTKEVGAKCALTSVDDLDQIRAAGADDELIQAIQQAAKPK
jgi:hypothetical protein